MLKHRPVRILLCLLLALLLAVGGYVAYVVLTYYRVEDNLPLAVTGAAEETLSTGTEVKLVSWNIGFGAYESDYDFFMDGGKQSWAWSEERLTDNLHRIGDYLQAQNGDLVLLQEVDVDSTRTYHINEVELLTQMLTQRRAYCGTFAQNYDSPFLLVPLYQPHGASKAGLVTLSAYPIDAALRRSLPIEGGFAKYIDLDRCYSVSRIPVAGGGELVLYNLHLSAYSSDGTISLKQLELLRSDMEREYQLGHYCIAAGDFNKDLLGDASAWFGVDGQAYTWAKPIPEGTFDGFHLTLVPPLDPDNPVPSCRNADAPYHEGQFVLTLDGFLVSDNVSVLDSAVLDTAFQYSDHNPVVLRFVLRERDGT